MSSRYRRRSGWAGLTLAESKVTFSNDGSGRLKVPGFGLPLHFELDARRRFSHGASDWAQPRLTVREIAMIQLMNDITDRPNWDTVVLEDAKIAAKWRDQALLGELISPATWDWCFAELRDRARTFRQTGCVDALNSSSIVCKADGVISAGVLASLQVGFDALVQQEQDSPHYNPGYGYETRHLVDPTLYPLVFGQSKVLTSGGRVPLSDIFSCIGKGEQAPHFPRRPPPPVSQRWGGKRWVARVHAAAYRSSTSFQMLPCEVAFHTFHNKNGSKEYQVKITSYINNLHPRRHSSLYRSIESVLEAAIPLWDRVLVKREVDRLPLRIRTSWGQIGLSNDPGRGPHVSIPPSLLKTSAECKSEDGRLRHALHPEPGVSISYYDWRMGKKAGSRPIPDTRRFPPIPPHQNGKGAKFTTEHPDHNFPYVNLGLKFQAAGLQVIVRLTHRTLLPGDAHCEVEDWHIDGMLNDHIVAGAILVVESTNTKPAEMEFRVEADLNLDLLNCGYLSEEELMALEKVYGLQRHPWKVDDCEQAVQNLGVMKIPAGRVVAYPNVLQHRLRPLELVDPSRPGHQYMLTCFLVDPHYRVCSTKNVPPQRHDWWIDEITRLCNWPWLPAEIYTEITQHDDVYDFPVGKRRAKEWKERMDDQMEICREAVDFGIDRYKFRERDKYDCDLDGDEVELAR